MPVAAATAEHLVLLVGSFLLLLVGAEVFTNGIEWLGHRLGVSESATGSVLAAVGTALPETMIPIIAIYQQSTVGGAAADEVGVGAILGAPFMLATIAMFLIGWAVLHFRERRETGAELRFDARTTRRDVGFFLVGYTLAFLTALIKHPLVHDVIGVALVLLYLLYLHRSLQSGDLIEASGLDSLHLGRVVEGDVGPLPALDASRDHRGNPHGLLVAAQIVIALAFIVGGAQLFVVEVQWVSVAVFGIPTAVVALLLAPLATELPEKFNSVLWLSRGKDTLALGNVTGAMAFQGTLPVTLGIVFTSWDISLAWGTTGFLNGFSALLAIASGLYLYLRARRVGDGSIHPRPFLLGGALYALFLLVVLYHVVVLDVTLAAGH